MKTKEKNDIQDEIAFMSILDGEEHINQVGQNFHVVETQGDYPQLSYLEKDKYVYKTGVRLPHWHQANKVQFVTFRLADSLPQTKLRELEDFKSERIRNHPLSGDRIMDEKYSLAVAHKVDVWLGSGYGNCILKRPDIRMIVEDALLFFDGKRYILYAYVIMPNHVHVLLAPLGEFRIPLLIGGVKRHSAKLINKALGRQGVVWQKQAFDRMVLDNGDFERYVQYIANNPVGFPRNHYSIGGYVFNVAAHSFRR